MSVVLEPEIKESMLRYCVALGDDLLVLGHRLSEWCGHGPFLEEDIALANMALDCIGEAQHILQFAGDLEGKGRSADTLAYFRNEYEFRNCLLVEQENGDFAQTILRQFFFDVYLAALFDGLKNSASPEMAAFGDKFSKEVRYHLRHSHEWILRFGGGTEESRQRARQGIDALWMYTGELFETNSDIELISSKNIVPRPETIRSKWLEMVTKTLTEAQLSIPPADTFMMNGGRAGRHSEALGHMLAEMQIVARSHPGATW